MRPLLSDISSVIVTDLLPKKAIKTPHELHFPCQKKYLPIQLIFPFLFDLLGWMGVLGKKNTTESKFGFKIFQWFDSFFS